MDEFVVIRSVGFFRHDHAGFIVFPCKINDIHAFFLIFVYFSAVDKIAENSEQINKENHERRFAYYNGQAKYLDEFRQFRHDYKNRLAGLKALLDNGDTERAKEYLADIIKRVTGKDAG